MANKKYSDLVKMPPRPSLNELCRRAIKHWGEDAQTKRVTEELAALIVALSKFGRKVRGVGLYEVSGEIADVEIMLAQLKVILSNFDIVESVKDSKLIRLEEMLKEEEKHD